MDSDHGEDAPIGYLVAEMEAFILKMAAEIDRLRARVRELEAGLTGERNEAAANDRAG